MNAFPTVERPSFNFFHLTFLSNPGGDAGPMLLSFLFIVPFEGCFDLPLFQPVLLDQDPGLLPQWFTFKIYFAML